MAERLVLELKEKVWSVDAGKAAEGLDRLGEAIDPVREDALSALVNLGYKKQTACGALDRVIRDCGGPVPLDQLLKKTLKILSG
jgi:Holliday junction DNA helicase RuvA